MHTYNLQIETIADYIAIFEVRMVVGDKTATLEIVHS